MGEWSSEASKQAVSSADCHSLSAGRAAIRLLLARRPELRLLVGDVQLDVASLPEETSFIVRKPQGLVVASSVMNTQTVAVHLRHGIELAWLRSHSHRDPAIIGILAARTAALFLKLETIETRVAAAADPSLAAILALSGDCPGTDALAWLWRQLARHQPGADAAFTSAAQAAIAGLWDFAGPTEHLLACGGDDRLTPDPLSGLNKYGCAMRPQPAVTSFSSCTASSIAESGYRAAELARRRLVAAALRGRAKEGLLALGASLREAILGYFGAGDLADAMLVPSGTDATLLALGFLTAGDPQAHWTSILMSPTETGSGVPQASTGRHFSTITAAGTKVAPGQGVGGFPSRIGLMTVPLRENDGRLRSKDDVDRDAAAAVSAAVGSGRAILHLLDCSKTGLTGPTVDAAMTLATRFGGRLNILVDACQARLPAERVRRYLARGWPVMLTGSKFFAGPPFAGALLVPKILLAGQELPSGLADYSAFDGWSHPEFVHSTTIANVGLLLRWSVAVAQMTVFSAVPTDHAIAALDEFQGEVRRALSSSNLLAFIDGMPDFGDARTGRQSIHSFAVRDPANPARWLRPDELRTIYQDLAVDLGADDAEAGDGCATDRFLIGQPVQVGENHDGPIGALRLAASAPSIVVGDSAAKVGRVFDKLLWMLRRRDGVGRPWPAAAAPEQLGA